MLGSAHCWQIQHLVSSLNESNYRTHIDDIEKIVMSLGGDNGRVVFMSSLLDEIDVRDGASRDVQRLSALHDELLKAMRQGNFAAVLCKSMESGNRAPLVANNKRLPEQYLLRLVEALKLTAMQAIAFLWGLSKSSYAPFAADATDLLRRRLAAVNSADAVSGGMADMADELLQSILLSVAYTPELSPMEVSRNFIAAMAQQGERSAALFAPLLRSASQQGQPGQQLSLSPQMLQLLNAASESLRAGNSNNNNSNNNGRRRISLTPLLIDLGHQCSATVDIFKRLLHLLKITEQTVDEAQIAEVIVAILPQTPRNRTGVGVPGGPPVGSVKPEHIPIYQQIKDSADDIVRMEATKEWNLDNVVEVLKQYVNARNSMAASGFTVPTGPNNSAVPVQAINWGVFVRALDQPLLRVVSETDFQILIKILLRLSGGKPISPEGLLARGVWANKAAQVSLIRYCVAVPRAIVDFSVLVKADQVMNDPTGSLQQPQNLAWIATPLYQMLMELSANGAAQQVLEVLHIGAKLFPEYVTVGLAQVQDNTGVRTEILRNTLPLFTGVSYVQQPAPGSGGSPTVVPARPTSTLVMRRLHDVHNAEMLLLLCRFALKKVTSVADLNECDQRFCSFPKGVIRKGLEEASGPEELLAYWCLLSDKGEFQTAPGTPTLEEKLKSLVSSGNANTAQMFRALFNLCSQNVKTLRAHANTYATTTPGGFLTVENFAMIFRLLQQAPPDVVPPEQLRALASEASNTQQQLQNKQQHGDGNAGSGGGGGNFSSGGISQAAILIANDINNSNSNSGGDASFNQQSGGNSVSGNGGSGGSHGMGGDFATDVENEANAIFQRIYTSEMSTPDMVGLFRQFKNSQGPREQEVFRCMVHNLMDEARFFHNYPEKELSITGRLFGALVQHQLIASITLSIALRYVLEFLRKDPENKAPTEMPATLTGGQTNQMLPPNASEKMFRFGAIALEQFRSRLPEWPQYCSHLLQIPHLRRHHPDIFADVQRALGGSTASPAGGNSGPGAAGGRAVSGNTGSTGGVSAMAASIAAMSMNQQQQPRSSSGSDFRDESGGGGNNSTEADSAAEESPAPTGPSIIDTMTAVNVEVANPVMPPEAVRDKIHFVINNIAKDNVDAKCRDLKELLQPDYYNWFSNYLVVKRISSQPNLHPVYISVLDNLNTPRLSKTVMSSILFNVTRLLQSPKIQSSSSERSLLRNMAIWIGQMTLGRNKVLLQRNLDVKELLLWGYETGRLIAVCSFVVKIIEGAKDSRVFRLPNPWLAAVLGVLRELNDLDDLKMNIKFEIQVLYKSLGIKMEEVPRTSVLSTRRAPVKNVGNCDFSVRPGQGGQSSASPSLGASASSGNIQHMSSQSPAPGDHSGPQQGGNTPSSGSSNNSGPPPPAPVNIAALLQEQTVIPNLASYVVVNPAIQYFQTNSSYRKLLALAVDKAIREIILPVVERAVGVASVTTRSLVPKDLMFEPNEAVVRSSAHAMVSSLAGSLAVISCREPLRVSISNHLRSVFTPLLLPNGANNVKEGSKEAENAALLEQIVQVCANDNVEMGCLLIEKAATEKSVREVDEGIAPMIQLRRKSREAAAAAAVASASGSSAPIAPLPMFYDAANNSNVSSRCFRDLPDYLKPKMGVSAGAGVAGSAAGSLTPQQQAVYETGFQRSGPGGLTARVSGSGSSGNTAQSAPPPTSSNTAAPSTSGGNTGSSAGHSTPSLLATPPAGSTAANLPALVPQGAGGVAIAPVLPPASGGGQQQQPPQLSLQQAMEAYQHCFVRLDAALKSIQVQVQARGLSMDLISLTMLGADHEIPAILREIAFIASRTSSQPAPGGGGSGLGVRVDSASTVFENIFKRLVETAHTADILRIETMVAILEALKDACNSGDPKSPTVTSANSGGGAGSGAPSKVTRDVTRWLQQISASPNHAAHMNEEAWRARHRQVLLYLLKARVVTSAVVDEYLAQNMDGGRSITVVELALTFVKLCVVDGTAATYEFTRVFDIVSRMNPANVNVRKQLQKWLTDLRALAASKDENAGAGPSAAGGIAVPADVGGSVGAASPAVGSTGAGGVAGAGAVPPSPPSAMASAAVAAASNSMREHVLTLLERWLHIWNSGNDQLYSQYLQMVQGYGVLKEDSADRFFRMATELCVEACLKSAVPLPAGAAAASGSDGLPCSPPSALTYTVMDALSKLFLLLIRVADKEAAASAAAGGAASPPTPPSIESSIAVRAAILLRILTAVTKVVAEGHDAVKRQQVQHVQQMQQMGVAGASVPVPGAAFDQRPYHRLLLNLVNELGPSEPKVEQSLVFVPLLNVYTQAFLAVSPATCPGFAFAWMNIISHPTFMPHLLLSKERKAWPLMHKLLITLLHFLHPFLRAVSLNDGTRRLYKETLRVLLVLLHDFPEFLCDYYLSFCDAIPAPCVQLRNLVLSAFPSSVRLPDPFTPNLKLEAVPEISNSPRILTDFVSVVTAMGDGAFKPRLDAYLASSKPFSNSEFLTVANLKPLLMLPAQGDAAPAVNIPVATALVVYVGSYGANQLKASIAAASASGSTTPSSVSVQQTSSYELLKFLVVSCMPDAECRYGLLNCLANQLRYPNSHTLLFSASFQQLFMDLNACIAVPSPDVTAAFALLVQEQITRVFLERLIVHRPHPWGLLVTFIDFLKAPKYKFWSKDFTRCAVEIEKVLEGVAKSCVTAPNAATAAVSVAGAPVVAVAVTA